MALSSAFALGASQLASRSLIGRVPGMAVFAAGLLAGALIVVIARRMRQPVPRNPVPRNPVPRNPEARGGPDVPVAVAAPVAPIAPASPPASPPAAPAQPQPRGEAARRLRGEEDGCTPCAGGRRADRGHHRPVAAAGTQSRHPPTLRIGVLGSLTVNGQAGALVPAQSQLIAALALHRGGLGNGQLRRLLGADASHPKPADSLRQLIARTRRALGQAPGNRQWIEHLGHGHYALHHDAWLDCREFETLTAAGIQRGEAPPLAAALSLVRGQPFTGCYYWWLEPELVDSVTARVVAAAEALATLKLSDGDHAAAVRAASIGLAADASAEQLWRILMRAEHAAGNLAGVRGAWGRCLDAVAEVAADGQPDAVTSAVYSELLAR